MRAALGMDKGAEISNKSSSKTVTDHYRTIAQRILIPHSSGRWSDAPPDQMGKVVKNRINMFVSNQISYSVD
jgi:hypothetical protein